MSSIIVQSDDVVTLIGGGALTDAELAPHLTDSGLLVAADGGARHVLRAGRTPDAVIGDLDSLSQKSRAAIPAEHLHEIPEQDSTDFEKCLSRIRAPLVVGLGFMGPRLDHQLAAYHGLMRCADQPCVLTGPDQCAFLCPPEIRLAAQVGDVVSLYPLVPVTAQSHGLQWPLDGLDLRAGGVIGTSNRASDTVVTLRCNQPGLLVILPAPALALARSALLEGSARWPVRAG